MGQQQLLLLALSAVIVGLSIVVGLNMFGQNAAQANLDAVTNDVFSIAARAQGWARKPAAFGGGGGAFTGISTEVLGFQSNGAGGYTNENGTYTIDGTAGTSATIVGTGVESVDDVAGDLSVTVTVYTDSVLVASITY